MAKTPGKLIVIEGTDGTGKATQSKLLYERLLHAGYSAALIDFPQYNKKSAGPVEEYLEGKYGEANEVDPYIASMFYAIDRYDAAKKMQAWIDNGKIVIANRYLTSSMAHQGSKLRTKLDRRTFYDWLYNLEYRLFKIPMPDSVFVLHVPALVAQNMTKQRNIEEWHNKKRDIHEGNIEHLSRSEEIYLEIAKLYNNISIVHCTKHGRLYTREFIAEAIWRDILPTLPVTREYTKAPDFTDLHDASPSRLAGLPEEKPTFVIKRLNSMAKLPQNNLSGSAYELYSIDYYSILPGASSRLATGLNISLPKNYIALVWDQNHDQILKFFDHSHNNELLLNYTNNTNQIINITPGQKIAELYIQKTNNLNISE